MEIMEDMSSWTMKKKYSTHVPIAGIDDKCPVTTIVACSLRGDFLPVQVIYQGKTVLYLEIFQEGKLRFHEIRGASLGAKPST